MSTIEKSLEEAIAGITAARTQLNTLREDPEFENWMIEYDSPGRYKIRIVPLDLGTLYGKVCWIIDLDPFRRPDEKETPEQKLHFLEKDRDILNERVNEFLQASNEFLFTMMNRHPNHSRMKEMTTFIISTQGAVTAFKSARIKEITSQIAEIIASKVGKEMADVLIKAEELRQDLKEWTVQHKPSNSLQLSTDSLTFEDLYGQFRAIIHLMGYKNTVNERVAELFKTADDYFKGVLPRYNNPVKMSKLETFINSMKKALLECEASQDQKPVIQKPKV